jgi:large subunit ribosomal protein L27
MLNLKPILLNPIFTQVRHASKKSGGSTSNGRTSNPKFRGFKKANGALVEPGNIILRQMGSKFHAGKGVGTGRDFTLFALEPGRVCIHYDLERQLKYVSIDVNKPSAKQIKQELRDMVNVGDYLKLSSEGRYDYVMGKVNELVRQKKEEEVKAEQQSIMNANNRKFHLIDLTLV